MQMFIYYILSEMFIMDCFWYITIGSEKNSLGVTEQPFIFLP